MTKTETTDNKTTGNKFHKIWENLLFFLSDKHHLALLIIYGELQYSYNHDLQW